MLIKVGHSLSRDDMLIGYSEEDIKGFIKNSMLRKLADYMLEKDLIKFEIKHELDIEGKDSVYAIMSVQAYHPDS